MRKILLSLMMLLVMAVPAMAMTPCPLAIKFRTTPADANVGLSVDITHEGKVLISGVSNEYGEMLMDVGDRISDCGSESFGLIVKDCEDKGVCHQAVSFNPRGYTTIDLTSIELPVIVTTTTTVTTPPEPCPDCPELPEDEELILYVIALVGLGLVIGFVFKKKELISYAQKIFKPGQYVRLGKYWNGVASAKHLHKGIRGYHDPDIEHKDPADRHPKGKLAGKEVP